jgi:hypothetical protein
MRNENNFSFFRNEREKLNKKKKYFNISDQQTQKSEKQTNWTYLDIDFDVGQVSVIPTIQSALKTRFEVFSAF